MALWEYKVITSGKGGFATPALLEKFLNDLGREEWEIVEFRSASDNALAFTGLARRSTQRDWTLEDAAAAAAKAEAEKLRAEFSAKFQAATANGPAAEEKAPSFLEEKSAPDDGFRKPVDTSRDADPDAPEEEAAEKDEWDKLGEEEDLPSFFDALKPHMRRNQRGPGMSVGTDYLAKKWGLDESDIKSALVECGLQIPADENAKPVHVEFEGDLYWVNINRRGEVWINTREKPRPVFRVVQANRVTPEAPDESRAEAPKTEDKAPRVEEKAHPAHERAQKLDAARHHGRGGEQPEKPENAADAPAEKRETAPVTSGAPLPSGLPLLERIRPLMRRNRRGPGGSGSASFLARALKCSEGDLIAGFATLGLVLPAAPADQPVNVEIGKEIWWLNQDSRGGVWINGREKRKGEQAASGQPGAGAEAPATMPASDGAAAVPVATDAPATTAAATPAPELPLTSAPATAASPTPETAAPEAAKAPAQPLAENVLPAVRLLLKETRTGSFAGKIDRVAESLAKPAEELTAALVSAGLKVPEKAREKPVFVEHAGEIFWFNQNAKGELWINAKASKFADKESVSDVAAEAGPAGAPSDGGKRPRRGGGGRGKKPAGSAGE